MADSLEIQVVKLRLQVAQLTLESLGLQQRLAQYQHRDAMQAAGQLQQILTELQGTAEPSLPKIELSESDALLIEKIKTADGHSLPQLVTVQIDGKTMVPVPNGQPRELTAVELAIQARLAEVRKEAGG